MRNPGEKLFSESTLLDGLPEILGQEPWAKIRSMVFSAEKEALLERVRTSQTLTGIDALPEKILDLLALDHILHQYRDTDDIEKKRENIHNAWLFWSYAGTRFATQRVTDIFFDGTALLEEWFEYDGPPNYFRVTIWNRPTDWNEIIAYMDASDYFRRLSQKLEEIAVIFETPADPIYVGAGSVTAYFDHTEVWGGDVEIYIGVFSKTYFVDTTVVDTGIRDGNPPPAAVKWDGAYSWDGEITFK